MIPFPPWFFLRPAAGPGPAVPIGRRSVVVVMRARVARDGSSVRSMSVATPAREAVA
jgi:hypothetical protein